MNSGLKYSLYLIPLLIAMTFLLGYCSGRRTREVVCYRPSATLYLEMAETIDSMKNIFPQEADTVFKDGSEAVVLHPAGYVEILRQFHPEKSFEDYPVTGRYTGPVPALNFRTCEYGKRYITMTRYGVQEGVQFAGYYAFARWGCGAPCQMCAIIDLRTGNVYAGPYATGGYEYRVDSRILVVNPPDSSGHYFANGVFPGPEQYLWTGTEFKRLE